MSLPLRYLTVLLISNSFGIAQEVFQGAGYVFTVPPGWRAFRDEEKGLTLLRSRYREEIQLTEIAALSTDGQTAHNLAAGQMQQRLGYATRFYLNTMLLPDNGQLLILAISPTAAVADTCQRIASSVRIRQNVPPARAEPSFPPQSDPQAPPQRARQATNNDPAFRPLGGFDAQAFIQRLVAKGDVVDEMMRNWYGFRRVVQIQDFSGSGATGGEVELVWQVIRKNGVAYKKVVYETQNTMAFLSMTPEDREDMWNVQPFILTSKLIGLYDVQYIGTAVLRENLTHKFNVKPRAHRGKQRYFEGAIYVDDADAEIVQLQGRGVGYAAPLAPGATHCFPEFQTFFEKLSDVEDHWVPTRSKTSDETCAASRVRMSMSWTDYKDLRKGQAESTLVGWSPIEESR